MIELANGRMRLVRSSRVWPLARAASPVAEVCFDVGPALEALALAGDRLRIASGSCGERGAVLTRSGELLLGLGAVDAFLSDGAIHVETDPRAADVEWLGISADLAKDDCTLVWLDVSDPALEHALAEVRTSRARRLIIAIAGGSAPARRQLNRRLSGPLPAGRASCQHVDVDERFASRDEWLAYVRNFTARPLDLWLRISIGGVSAHLREGTYAFHSPWHLFVLRVYEPGLPGSPSMIGVAREHPALNREQLMESTRALASGRFEITQ